jgi:hypothetical protein
MRRVRSRAALALLALALLALAPASAQAAFGVSSVTTTATNRDGTLDFRAGSHPFEYTVDVAMQQNASHLPEGTLRNLVVNLPRGFVGDPLAVPRCGRAEFEGPEPECPNSTAIGVAHVRGSGGIDAVSPIYNLVPAPGVPASFGFSVIEKSSYQLASVRSGGDYGVTITDDTIPTSIPIVSLSETIWGVPAESSHDAERGHCAAREKGSLCPSGAAPLPFLTLPTSCSGPLLTTVQAESLEAPGILTSPVAAFSTDGGGAPAGLVGCEKPAFKPSVVVQPSAGTADSPTGLQFHLHIPQNENPEGIATSELKSTTVSLPPGLAVDPSAADGLAACSEAQIGLEGGQPARCPAASKVGSVQIKTPLLENPLPGAVYLARQGENPYHSLLALYLTVYDPVSGVVVKLPGKVTPDPLTGRLSATFEENPQLPFEDLVVEFFGGPRATLTTPPTCGSYTTETDLIPWTSPAGADAHPSDSFRIEAGAGGGACASTEAQLPNQPTFEAGTVTPLAGSYSPFVLKVVRENGTQRIDRIDATLPDGLLGRIAGVASCSDVQIGQAASRRSLGEGALEQSSPSCPSSSEVGTVTVGVGSGAPYYVHGNVYLAGPYKGAPLSLEIVTPAVAGPFDLGTVAVRTALYVNESTAQIHAVSDQIPSILAGIPLDVRSIALEMNRPQFTLNPTSCGAMAVIGSTTSTLGQSVALQNRFQVGGCNGLAFKPELKLAFTGATKRTGFPAVKAVLTQPKGQNANLAGAQVILPKGMLIANAHINSPCTRVQFNSTPIPGGGCPAKSILGTAKVWTPLLEKPEEGNVYFRSNGGERQLPDLAVALRGQIPLQLVGFVDSVGKKGAEVRRVRTRFQSLPDAPVSRFELKLSGGKKGLLQNSKNLCKVSDKANFALTGQNGAVHDTEPKVQVACGKGKKSGRSR